MLRNEPPPQNLTVASATSSVVDAFAGVVEDQVALGIAQLREQSVDLTAKVCMALLGIVLVSVGSTSGALGLLFLLQEFVPAWAAHLIVGSIYVLCGLLVLIRIPARSA